MLVLDNRDEHEHADHRSGDGEKDDDAEHGPRSSAVEIQQAIFEGGFVHNFLFQMTDTRVAANAGHGGVGGTGKIDIVDDVLMTFAAGVFRDAPAAFLDLDRVVKFAGGEGERMKKTVLGFREILRNERRRRVTIVARGDRVMAGLIPAIEMIPHDVAVGAGIGVVPEIGRTIGIDERVTPETNHRTDSAGDDDREHDRHPGLRPE
jgi:hypothetical protein